MVNILPSGDEALVVDSALEVLLRECPVDAQSPPRDAQRERRLRTLFGELGWFRFGPPDDAGGNGFGLAEEMLLFRLFGRFLQSPSLAAPGLAAALLAHGLHADLRETILAGEVKVGLAYPVGPDCRILTPDGFLDGEVLLVDDQDARFVVAMDTERIALVETGTLPPSELLNALDQAVALRKVRARRCPTFVANAPDTQWLQLRASLLIAAQLLGVSEACRDLSADYAKLREQFGKPIGAFQAIAHSCADMAVRSEAALCQVLFATIVARDQGADACFEVAAAAQVASDAAFRNATAAIRVHGGIGFTAECNAHRYLKRSVLLRQLGSVSSDQEQALLTASTETTP